MPEVPTVPEVKQGLLLYDVPEEYKLLAGVLRRTVRKFALRVNLSCYVFPWENKTLVEGTVAEVQERTGQECSARILAQSPVAEPELLEMAKESAGSMLSELHKGLMARIAKIPQVIEKQVNDGKINADEMDETRLKKSLAIIRDVQLRAGEIKNLSTLMQIEGSVQGWTKMVEELLAKEKAACEELKKEVDARKAAAKIA